MLDCFVSAKANSFETLLEIFLKITRISRVITDDLSKSPSFFKRILDRLSPTTTTKPVVRLNLLKLLRVVCDSHKNKAVLVEKYGLLDVVEKLSESGEDGAVLVRQLAKEMLPALKPALRSSTKGLHIQPPLKVTRGKSSPISSTSSSRAESPTKPPGTPITPRPGAKISLAPKNKMRRAASETGGMAFASADMRSGGSAAVGQAHGHHSTMSTSTARYTGTLGTSRTSRQRLGDIPWQSESESERRVDVSRSIRRER
jgi:hypothetical protein